MKRHASFVYYGDDTVPDRRVRLFTAPNGRWYVHAGGVCGTDSFHSAETAVAWFAFWRERSARDYGASEVDWDGYPHLKHYWPDEVTPWNEEIQ